MFNKSFISLAYLLDLSLIDHCAILVSISEEIDF